MELAHLMTNFLSSSEPLARFSIVFADVYVSTRVQRKFREILVPSHVAASDEDYESSISCSVRGS